MCFPLVRAFTWIFYFRKKGRNVSVKHLPSVHVCVGLWSNSINKRALFNLFSECKASKSPPSATYIKDKTEKNSRGWEALGFTLGLIGV